MTTIGWDARIEYQHPEIPDREPHHSKESWGPGPWQDEPDKIQWLDPATGLDCLIHRGPLGALCGYVGVTAGHPYFGKDHWDIDDGPDVHGGLTFSRKCAEGDDPAYGICHVPLDGRDPDVWWLGFDCGHVGDLIPRLERTLEDVRDPSSPRFFQDTYRDIAYVRTEVEQLAQQLAETR